MTWPALIFTSDFLPDHGPLNGRRWVSQLLFRLWLQATSECGLDLLAGDPRVLDVLRMSLGDSFKNHRLRYCSITDPFSLIQNGALFIPDPSIGTWASWRQSAGHHQFSLIGQIHTLSTSAVMNMLDALVYEPVQEWDALICSSQAGRSVVECVMDDRLEQLRHRCGVKHIPRPQLPVIPLPLDKKCFEFSALTKQESRSYFGLPLNASVVLWLGRRSMLTKADPWPSYHVLQRTALLLKKPLWLIECGPDDTTEQADHFQELQQYCPDVKFLRLGGSSPVSEEVKKHALSACDLVLSLVDNIQETFGLSIAEAMAAGRPVVASDWDGYRDLVRDGIDGFLVPSRWDEQASPVSFPLGWMQKLELSTFPHISGSLSQLVQIDLRIAEAAILTLLTNPSLAAAMGRSARQRALAEFDPTQVMRRYDELFAELTDRRENFTNNPCNSSAPVRFDPVRCFQSYASHVEPFDHIESISGHIPDEVLSARQPFADQILGALPGNMKLDWELLVKRKHT